MAVLKNQWRKRPGTNPMPENVIADYGWSSAVAPHSCGYLAPRILNVLAALRVRRVMDLGCGNGALCAELGRVGYDVIGVENDEKGVLIARDSHPDINFHNFGVQDDPDRLLAVEAPFDAVVSTEVIEHLFSPHLLPIFAKAVLCEGGYLVLTTPYHGYWKNLTISLIGGWDAHWSPLWHGGHIKFWSRSTLKKLLEINGFKVISTTGAGRFPYLWKSMVMVARKT